MHVPSVGNGFSGSANGSVIPTCRDWFPHGYRSAKRWTNRTSIPRAPVGLAGALKRAVAVATVAPLAAGGILLAINQSAQAAGPAFPAHYAAPYLQISTGDAGDITADMNATGLKYYTLAFLIPQSGCTPEWEDGGYGLTQFNSQISALQSAGGQVIISSGGAEGGELALTCTSVTSLTAAYANIVNSTGVTRLDFDIEGSTLSNNTAATTRRDQALAALQTQNPAVQVDFTLAVGRTVCRPAAARSTRCCRTPRPRASTSTRSTS